MGTGRRNPRAVRPIGPALLVLASCVALTACSSAPKDAAAMPVDDSAMAAAAARDAEHAPQDFSIDVTIMTPPRMADPAAPAHRRAGRVVLFPNGVLRYSDATQRSDVLPAPTRMLARAQVDALWRLCGSLDLVDPDRGNVNFDLIGPPESGVTYLVAISGDDHRWSFIRRDAADSTPDPSIATLVRSLQALAWATDAPASGALVLPHRYDFGPDPYARFREP